MAATWLAISIVAASGCAGKTRVARTWPVPECPPEGIEMTVIDLRPHGLPFYGISPSSWRDVSGYLEAWQQCAKARGEVIEDVNRSMKMGESAEK
ncbi:MAG: hypothetical protein ACE5IQ_00825 [Candidatus Methylomirabilales bacterium]